MEDPKAPSNAAEAPQSPLSPKSVIPFRGITPIEMRPVFTLTFSLGRSLSDISDTVAQKVLEYTHGNRLAAAYLLQISTRTIQRHLGKKETTRAVTRAA
jgi:DNA-binding NtrC family response regulator